MFAAILSGRSRLLALTFAATAIASGSAFAKNPPGAQQASVAEQARGFYSRGWLADASELPAHGPGYVHLFEGRDRHYGAESLVHTLTHAAEAMAYAYPNGERLQFGDISAREGGKITRHASHQNGLDVDVVYYRVNRQEQTAEDGEEGFKELFVTPTGRISANFDAKRNWELIKLLHQSGRISRIFMDHVIKAALCRQARAQGEVEKFADALRRLRPIPHHQDHMHVRLACPAGSRLCQEQRDLRGLETGCPAR